MIRPSVARVRSPGGFHVEGLYRWRDGVWVPVIRRSISFEELRIGWACDHRALRSHCHPNRCGHLLCPDCGLYWDEGASR